jgi:hypothetical protein
MPEFPPSLDITLQQPPPPEEHESIFSAPTAGSEDLFGQPSAPKVEFPTEVLVGEQQAAAPGPDPSPNLELAPVNPAPGPAANPDATLTYMAPDATLPGVFGVGDLTVPQSSQPAPAPTWPAPAPPEPSLPPPTEVPTDAATAAILARKRSRSGWYIALFIIPLISYAVLASIAAGILWFRQQEQKLKPTTNPLEVLPDVDGEFPTNRKGSKRKVIDRLYTLRSKIYPKPSSALPDSLKVRLGKTLELGELEVTPLRIERGTIEITELGRVSPERVEGEVWKLFLRFRNRSDDLEYYPMDRYFTRYWRGDGKRGSPPRFHTELAPYTYLQVGEQRFYGGPAGFYDLDLDPANKSGNANEYIVGQDFKLLKPGEEMETFICTDPTNPDLQKAIAKHEEGFLWRVQVRRGSVMNEGRRIPCTAVVGVPFTKADIEKQ